MVHWSTAASRECGCSVAPETARLLGEEEEATDEGPEVPESELPPSIVQFSTEQFFCTEDEGEASVDVVRLGEATGSARFRFETQDGSAKAGHKFEARWGEMTFEPGETVKTIKIPLLVDSGWDSTLEFSVALTKVWSARKGAYLDRCLVSVIDDDAFPTNKYKDEVGNEEGLASIPGLALMLEFVRMCLGNRALRSRTVAALLLDQIKNLYFLMTIYLQMYLVDVVLRKPEEEAGEAEDFEARRLFLGSIHGGARLLARALGEEGEGFGGEGGEAGPWPMGEEAEAELLVPGSRHYTAVVVGLLYVLPFFALHVIDVSKVSMRLAGMTRKLLQEALMRKFLTFKEDVRGSISTGDLSMTLTRDISEVVDHGYMKLISMACVLSKLCYALGFILNENKMAAVPLLVFMVAGGTFLLLREPQMIQSNEEMARMQNRMVHTVHDIIDNNQLVRDFQLRPFIVGRYEQRIMDYNARATESAFIMMNNSYLPPWLMTLLVGGYMVIGTFQVKAMGGNLSLGAFFATLNVFKEIGTEMHEIYMEMMEIMKVTGPLRTVCFFMNQPTFLPGLMARNRKRREKGASKHKTARQSQSALRGSAGAAMADDGSLVFAVDTLTIELSDVTFRYHSTVTLFESATTPNGVSREFQQGRLYAFTGAEHHGKATMLRILAGVLIPETGDVFVPPHMRVLHVVKEALILNESFLKNIVFDQQLQKLGGYERISRLCSRIGFKPPALKMLEDSYAAEQEGSQTKPVIGSQWTRSLSNTDFARLNLARALVMNPECLIMHMPFISFSDGECKKILELVRAHVNERGLELPKDGRKFRRPRTVFFSSSTLERCANCDCVFEVAGDSAGLRELPVPQ